MYIIDTNGRFDEEKAKRVLKEHGVNMEDVRLEILAKRFDVQYVLNQEGHSRAGYTSGGLKMANSEFEPMDEEEKHLMEAIERGDTKPVPAEELEAIKASVKGSAHNITIRMNDADIEGMKIKASRLGINYQTLIKTLVHRYLTGGVTINEAF